MDILSYTGSLQSALNTSSKGVQKASSDFAEAANETVESFAAGANELNASFESDLSLEGSTYLSSNNTGDPLTGIMDMKFAEQAYKASLAVMETTDEMMDEAIDRLA